MGGPGGRKQKVEKWFRMMEDFRILLRMRISHEYFEGKGHGCLSVRLGKEMSVLLRNRQMIFRQESADSWILLGNVSGNGVDGESDRLVFEVVVNDPFFLYYTKWEGYDGKGCYELEMPVESRMLDTVKEVKAGTGREKKAGVLFSGQFRLSDRMYEVGREGRYAEVVLAFGSKEVFWEYILVPRKEADVCLSLRLVEQGERLLFSVPEKGKSGFTDYPIWRCVSQTPVKMKWCYPYQLDLVEMIREEPEIRRKVLKCIGLPVPGQFHDAAGDYLRKVVYF